MLRVASVFSRSSPMARKAETLLARAKDKKGGKGGAAAPTRTVYDVSDAPKGKNMLRVAWFWNKFCLQEGEKPVILKYPWKEGEEPRWYKELTIPPETLLNPEKQLDPRIVGPKKYSRSINRLKIKAFNRAMVTKDFTTLKKNQKQLPP